MTWGWQQLVTLLLISAAVVYVTRHVLRSMTSEPGAGCGVSSGCAGCTIKTKTPCEPVITQITPPRAE